MPDKSPRNASIKNTTMTIKQKRAAKKRKLEDGVPRTVPVVLSNHRGQPV
jgi:hypothetical protein